MMKNIVIAHGTRLLDVGTTGDKTIPGRYERMLSVDDGNALSDVARFMLASFGDVTRTKASGIWALIMASLF